MRQRLERVIYAVLIRPSEMRPVVDLASATGLFVYPYDMEQTITAVTQPTVSQGQGETILIVEDNEALRETLAIILVERNYHVVTAADGHEALAVLEQDGEGEMRRTSPSRHVMWRHGEGAQETHTRRTSCQAKCF